MKRHPVRNSIFMVLAGVLMLGVMRFVPLAECLLILGVGGGVLILLGIISLLLAVGSALWMKVKK